VEERRRDEFADCLRTRSVEDLVAAAKRVTVPSFTTAFGPVVDGVLIRSSPRRSIHNNAQVLSRCASFDIRILLDFDVRYFQAILSSRSTENPSDTNHQRYFVQYLYLEDLL
jgi:hypothetical protein